MKTVKGFFDLLRSFCLLCCFALLFTAARAQTVSISYPSGSAAQALTRGDSSGLLTVRLTYSAACSGNTVTIALPTGVLYVAGSVVKTSGTSGVSATTISESNITNLRKPVFTTSTTTGAGDFTFTIARIANCGSGSSGKDSVYVSGNCGTASEVAGTTNTYNILSPVLTQTGPATIANAYINQQYSRTFRITNGGNGCVDTLRLAIKRPASLTNAVLLIGSTSLTPYATNSDTSFYKIAGANLPGGDNLMCNGEYIDFTEQFMLMNCASLSVTYLASWGRPDNVCSVTTTASTITMATGSANIAGASTRLSTQQLNWCHNGIFTITLTNGAATAGGKANAAYNVLPNIGYNATGTSTAPAGNATATRGRIDSFKIGTVTVPIIAATSTLSAQANFPGLTSDPDGAGVGLDDLDGDGQYDDLAPGKSVAVTVYEHWDNSVTNTCPTPVYNFYNSYTATYSSMCGTAYTTNPLAASGLGAYRILANAGGSLTTPAEVSANTPFTVQACVNLSSYSSPYAPVDSLYLDVILPPGVSPAPTPNILYDGVAVPASGYYVDTVLGTRTLHVIRKGRASSFCYSLSLIYDCTGGTSISPQFNIRYKGDTCSSSIDYHMCKSSAIKVSCPSTCVEGIRNYLPIAKRLTLGYTDATLSAKVDASAVSGLAVYTAIALDTVQIIVPGKQLTALTSYNNLYYSLQLGKSGSADVFQFLSGTFNQVSGGSTATTTITTPSTTGSTSALQKLSWDLSSNLKNGIISNNDSVWLDLRFAITRANTDALYANTLTQVPNTSSTLYNRTAANVAIGCDTAHAINLLISGNASVSNYTAATTLSSCGAVTITSSEYFGNATGLDIYPAEYRPQIIIDSVQITLPTGYALSTSYSQYSSKYWNTLVSYGSNATSTAGITTATAANMWTVKNPYIAGTTGWLTADLGATSLSNYSLSFQVSPTCAAVVGTQNYTMKWFYRDFIYTGNTNAYANKNNTVTSTLTYNSAVIPALTLQNNTGAVQGVLAQHYWDIQLNSSGNGVPLYTWMAIDRLNSGITVDSVIYDGSNITSTGAYYSTNKTWFQLTATGIASGASKAARIYFKYTSCSADSIKVLAGWNCIGYPSPDPSYNSCTEISQYLKVIPQSSQIQLSLLRQPGNGNNITLCAMDSVSAIINSAASANATNPVVTVTPPTGMTIVTPLPVEYPLGSGRWQMLTPTLNAGVYTINLSDHTGIGAAGLKGVTAAAGVTENRQAKIVVQYSVNCSFTANSLIGFNVYGTSPCGATAIGNGNRVNSNGVSIAGATITGSANMSITAATTDFSCGDAASTVSLSVTPLGGVATSVGDVATYSLPAGLGYVDNSFVAGSNCGGCTITATAGNGGTTDITVSLAQGVASGNAMNFSIQVQPTAGAGCAGNITGAFRRNISAFTCNGTACSVSQAIIASASQAISIKKPQLDVVMLSSTNNCYPTAGYLCSYNLTVKNNGTVAAAADAYKAEFFCSGNATPLYVYTLPAAIAIGATYNETVSFSIPISCYNKQLSVKISPAPVSGGTQCLCSESSYQLAIILPLKLVSFEATPKTNAVALVWKTTNEENVKNYAVERSLNGVNFLSVGSLVAHNTIMQNTYDFTDNQLPITTGIIYYRIRISDVNGVVTYSSVATVRLAGSGAMNVLVMPNPVKNILQVILPINTSAAQMRLVNATGQSVISKVSTGSINTINASSLSSGIYLLQIITNGKLIYTQKILKD